MSYIFIQSFPFLKTNNLLLQSNSSNPNNPIWSGARDWGRLLEAILRPLPIEGSPAPSSDNSLNNPQNNPKNTNSLMKFTGSELIERIQRVVGQMVSKDTVTGFAESLLKLYFIRPLNDVTLYRQPLSPTAVYVPVEVCSDRPLQIPSCLIILLSLSLSLSGFVCVCMFALFHSDVYVYIPIEETVAPHSCIYIYTYILYIL